MRRSRKQIVSVAAVIALTQILAGCSTGSTTTTEKGKSDLSNLSAVSTFPIVKEKTTLKMAALKSAPQITDFNNLPIFQDLEKKTNVHVEWTLTNRGDEWKQRKNLLFASNDVPDVLIGSDVLDPDEVVQYGSQGLLLPLNDLIDKHMPNLKAIFDKNPDIRKSLTTPDGKIYSLPRLANDPAYTANDVLYVNKKWLDKLNLKVPTTTEEFKEVLKAFKANGFASGGNIPASFTFGINNGSSNGFDSLAGSFGIVNGPNGIYMDKDKVKHYYSQPEYKQFLEFMNSLYKDGLIDPETFTQNSGVYQAKVKEEKVGFTTLWSNTVTFGVPESAYVPVPALKGPTGKQLWRTFNIPISSVAAAAISSTNKQPEVTARWMDVMYDQETGFQMNEGYFGVQYKVMPDNSLSTLSPPQGMASIDWKLQYIPRLWPGVESAEALNRLKDAVNRNEKQKTSDMLNPFIDPNPYPSLFFPTDKVARLKVLKTDIDGYVLKSVPQFIINGVTDQSWNDYSAQLKKMGIDEWHKIYQEGYDKFKNSK